MSERFGSKLVQNTRQKLGNLFVLAVTGDSESVCRQRSLHLGVVEVNHRPIVLDHVNLLDAGDVVHLKRKAKLSLRYKLA